MLTSRNSLKSRKELDAELGGAARAWLDEALAEAAHDAADAAATPGAPRPGASPYASPPWELRYAAAGRHCGQENADSVRSLLLVEARAALPSVTRLYDQGTAAERRAVLLTLHLLDLGDTALPLIEDALRANDTRLVAAAVGPYAADHLDPHSWRHAVLKCLFTEVPVAAVARLGERAHGDAELARMLNDFAAERTAAGRPVPEDLRTVLALTAPAGEGDHPARPTAAPAAPAPTEES
ncbi:EboA domain-containing protein [Streptomyces sp. WA6-1-16]|uniref:EboA domain-containing protein n=1 Tax=Streptomyces sp. WA6-1-16 TaxID=2879427 RepID=UPI001CE3B405|nr:EboA domain-containing protein [Streptomyces sp. WA6-1-16]UCA51893.1 EboA domain-containing protein [Streptomyces sp. WA6-1-16]